MFVKWLQQNQKMDGIYIHLYMNNYEIVKISQKIENLYFQIQNHLLLFLYLQSMQVKQVFKYSVPYQPNHMFIQIIQ